MTILHSAMSLIVNEWHSPDHQENFENRKSSSLYRSRRGSIGKVFEPAIVLGHTHNAVLDTLHTWRRGGVCVYLSVKGETSIRNSSLERNRENKEEGKNTMQKKKEEKEKCPAGQTDRVAVVGLGSRNTKFPHVPTYLHSPK
jgi:hypothetical protein